MEGFFEALLQFFFQLLMEMTIEIIGEIAGENLFHLGSLAAKVNLPNAFLFSDEIIKLGSFN